MKGGHALINIGSGQSSALPLNQLPDIDNQGNGGHGGDASSGTAYAHGPEAKAYSGAGGKATGGNVDRRALINIRTGKASDFRFSPQGKYGRVPRDYDGLVDAFSGAFSRKSHGSSWVVNVENRKRWRWRLRPVWERTRRWLWSLCVFWPWWRCIWRVCDPRTTWQGRKARYTVTYEY